MMSQILRFAVVGATCALIYSAIYLAYVLILLPADVHLAAVFPAFLVSVYVGSHLQSRFTFKRGSFEEQRPFTRLKFFFSQAIGLCINCLITWVITGPLQGSDWVPLIPSILITPTVTFALQRWWVFGSTAKIAQRPSARGDQGEREIPDAMAT